MNDDGMEYLEEDVLKELLNINKEALAILQRQRMKSNDIVSISFQIQDRLNEIRRINNLLFVKIKLKSIEGNDGNLSNFELHHGTINLISKFHYNLLNNIHLTNLLVELRIQTNEISTEIINNAKTIGIMFLIPIITIYEAILTPINIIFVVSQLSICILISLVLFIRLLKLNKKMNSSKSIYKKSMEVINELGIDLENNIKN